MTHAKARPVWRRSVRHPAGAGPAFQRSTPCPHLTAI
jgi:hypothetical protein